MEAALLVLQTTVHQQARFVALRAVHVTLLKLAMVHRFNALAIHFYQLERNVARQEALVMLQNRFAF